MRKLEILGNQRTYKGMLTAPAFEVLNDKAIVMRQLHEGFQALGTRAADLRFDYGLALADQYVAIQWNRGHVKFVIDRIESNLVDFTPQDLEVFPRYLEASRKFVQTISPTVKIANHQFSYYGHAKIEGTTPGQFFSGLPSPSIASGGENLGTGFNFLWHLKDREWVTRLALDHSLVFSQALFVGLTVEVAADGIVYSEITRDIQKYLVTILADIDLQLET